MSPRAAHHRGAFARFGEVVRSRANANPSTRCGQLPNGEIHPDGCGLTKAEHRREWEAGHVVRGKVVTSLADLMPQCARCNRSSGARDGNRMRRRITSRDWYA